MDIKSFFYSFIFLSLFFLFPLSTKGVCPICTITTAGTVGLCRWLKIDDLLSGIWIGAFLVSFSLWLSFFLKKRFFSFPFQSFFILFFIYFLTLSSFYYFNLLGNTPNKIYNIERLLFGILTGTLCFPVAIGFHQFLRKLNKGKSFFSFQKIIIIFVFLIILTFVFYFIFKC